MNAQLYFRKAILQVERGQREKAMENLHMAVDSADGDQVSAAQSYCVLGEYLFIHQRYKEAKEHFMWISRCAEILERENDDLLNEEINRANVLLEIIERFSLG